MKKSFVFEISRRDLPTPNELGHSIIWALRTNAELKCKFCYNKAFNGFFCPKSNNIVCYNCKDKEINENFVCLQCEHKLVYIVDV